LVERLRGYDQALVDTARDLTEEAEASPIDRTCPRRYDIGSVRDTREAFNSIALPGGYPNFLAADDKERAAKSYGRNVARLIKAKRHYDPENIFRSTIP
jgi:hypothetical protein